MRDLDAYSATTCQVRMNVAHRAAMVVLWLVVSAADGLSLAGIARFAYEGEASAAQWFLWPAVFSSLVAVALIAVLLRLESRSGEAAKQLAVTIEQRFGQMLDTSTDLTAIVDESGTFTYVSPSVERLTGRSACDLLGQSISALTTEADQYSAGWLVASARSGTQSPQIRLRLAVAQGGERVVEASANNQLAIPSVSGIVVNARDITEQARLEHERESIRTRDLLTGVLNRARFIERVDGAILRAARVHRPLSLAVIDLDHFSVVNDQIGESAGDAVLRNVAERLEAVAGPAGVVGRLAGDRFGILLEGAGLTQAHTVLQTAHDSLSRPILLDTLSTPIGASIGLTSRGEGKIGTTDALIREAEAALTVAQQTGPGRLIIFAPTMAIPDGRLDLESELRLAVGRGEFTVFYQPVVGLNTCDVVEMEALIRWNHPDRGLVAPGDFIPVAVETGLIVPIDWWVLEEACRQGVRWLDRRKARLLTMSVNLSPRMFRQGDLVHRVRMILAETRFPADQLRLEITEGVMIEDRQQAATVLRALKSMGIQLAIDDFGTGYSSLAYLRHFPVDVIKIDRSFVETMANCPESTEIVRTIVDLAKRLNLETTGEGVETADQLAQLRELGSDRGQGFFFSRPLPPEELDHIICDDASYHAFAA